MAWTAARRGTVWMRSCAAWLNRGRTLEPKAWECGCHRHRLGSLRSHHGTSLNGTLLKERDGYGLPEYLASLESSAGEAIARKFVTRPGSPYVWRRCPAFYR